MQTEPVYIGKNPLLIHECIFLLFTILWTVDVTFIRAFSLCIHQLIEKCEQEEQGVKLINTAS